MSSGKWRPFCLGLNVLKACVHAFTAHYRHPTKQYPIITQVLAELPQISYVTIENVMVQSFFYTHDVCGDINVIIH